jgi:futalosine hydrolase
VDVLTTGIGPVEAAAATARAIAFNPYELVINAGIAGALAGAATIGDGVVVSEDRFELNLETDEALTLPGGNRVVERAESDSALVNELVKRGFAALHGVTVARVTATDATAARLASLGAQLETMEGFALLRAAQLGNVRAIEVRGISNIAGERSASGWNFAAGVAGLERVLSALLEIVAPDG